MLADPQTVRAIQGIYRMTTDYIGTQNMPSFEDFADIYGKMAINGFEICDDMGRNRYLSLKNKIFFFFQFQLGFLNTFRAWGIYLGASVVDHSCCPNANVVFDGRHIVIRSLKEFDSHDCGCDFSGNYLDMGKEVQITYIDVMEHTSVRIKKLQEQYYFTCECPRCLGIQLTWNSKLVH